MKRLLSMSLAVLILLAACSGNNGEGEAEERITPVETDAVTTGDVDMERHFYGRTQPIHTTPVIPTVAGEVDSLEAEKGEEVEEGDVLATIASQQGYIDIEAPQDGVITQLEAQEGNMVSNQEPFAVIIDLDELAISLQVSDAQLHLFEEGDEVSFTVANEEAQEAVIDYMANTANESGLFPVELSYNNEETQHKAGVVAKVTIKETVAENSLLIPTAALIEENSETFVYTVIEDHAKRIDVTVEATQSDITAIQAEDISEGDTVITSGHLTITDGDKIEVVGED
ncbi:efflux RND transporter periplasmic adaptor subunit [Gracilibacillus sp. YIM 98692]|uniref:efflux RND transporter periplasmic adaptor subunit n=1 Tax=Gracilibacillus sp. YIM 98692 TaxID=2663532 RepID=UPI0013D12B90|nr:efflux RND transporter periplasmic adaptor subunit [Gracilibacillus sp. YIM 98692]